MRFLRSLHLLALGTWLGAMVFFSFVIAPRVFMATGAVCPSCAEDVADEAEVATCGACGARHHAEHAGTCALLGCGGEAAVGTEPPALEAPEAVAVSRWARVYVREGAPAAGEPLWRLDVPGEREAERDLVQGAVARLPFPAAGDAQNVFFGPYYALGVVAGLLALATVWTLPGSAVRAGVLVVTLLLCGAGVVLLGQADAAQRARNADPTARAEAQATFDRVHQWSVAANAAMLLGGLAALGHAGWHAGARPREASDSEPRT